jgi:hypothetical protein
MPFWLTATLLIFLILYIIGVVKAIARNNQFCFKGNITFYDDQGNQLGDTVRLPKQASSTILTFGKGGSPRCKDDDAEWQFVVEKKKGCPLLVFAKPYFFWHCTQKYVAQGSSKTGKFGYYDTKTIRVKCGPSRGDLTHSVKIQLT